MYKKGFNDGVGALAQYLTDHACLYDLDNHHSFEGIDIDEMKSYVEEVRSFIPEINGQWDEGKYAFCYVCSECNLIIDKFAVQWQSGEFNYCPNCGTKMVKEKENV